MVDACGLRKVDNDKKDDDVSDDEFDYKAMFVTFD